MPDQEPNPEESFTFVDKRRTTEQSAVEQEPEVVEEPVAQVSEIIDEGDFEDSDPDEQQRSPSSIYDIAAYVTGMLATEAFQRLGLLADPQTGSAKLDLPQAKFAIDCVGALVGVIDSPDCKLPERVQREMKRTLNDLRLNYIDRARNV